MWSSKPLFPRKKFRCASLLLTVGVMLGVGFMVRLSQLPPLCFDVVFSFAWYVATTFCDSFRGNCSVYRMQCVHGTQDPLTSSFLNWVSPWQSLSCVWLFVTPWTVQFSSVAQSCLTLCDPMNCSTPGLPVHHHLPEFTQTHIHRVGVAIQPSHPLSSPFPPAPQSRPAS